LVNSIDRMAKKKGKKRRLEGNDIDVASLASKLNKKSSAGTKEDIDVSSLCEDEVIGLHGISDRSLETTISTLHKLCGLVDQSTGKLALKDKRYKSLRKVMYELQSTTSSTQSCNNNNNNDNNMGGVSSLPTSEISAMIDNGVYETAIVTLRNVRMRQEEYYSKRKQQSSTQSSINTNVNYLRPKLGTVQRWVRQVDAAGTNDPLALAVLDGILRICSPESILPIDTADAEKAILTQLGVRSTSISNMKQEGGRVRLFPPFDRRQKASTFNNIATNGQNSSGSIEHDLVRRMQVGEDGVRIIDMELSLKKDRRSDIFRQCGFEKGEDRRPPNKYDLEIVTTSETSESKYLEEGGTLYTVSSLNGLNWDMLNHDDNVSIVKSKIPYIKDSFLLENVLSPIECDRLIATAETAGYHPDEPRAGQPGESILAHACVWVVDYKLERTIFDRVKDFLPSYKQTKQGNEEETLQPLGLNRRFRFYRYVPGRYYRPHIDGAWPPSGFDSKGVYRYDICDDTNKNGLQFIQQKEEGDDSSYIEAAEIMDTKKQAEQSDKVKTDETNSNKCRRQMSRLTFLLYLNEDFDGGETTFLVPEKDDEGTLNAFPVKPVRGGILVFPHGTCSAPLHEGSPVLKRCKYVVRSEVEYYV